MRSKVRGFYGTEVPGNLKWEVFLRAAGRIVTQTLTPPKRLLSLDSPKLLDHIVTPLRRMLGQNDWKRSFKKKIEKYATFVVIIFNWSTSIFFQVVQDLVTVQK
jgi:hypothetical protein